MKKGYEEAIEMVRELEEILGMTISVSAYDGSPIQEELWWHFATPEEKKARQEAMRRRREEWYENASEYERKMADYRQQKMLSHLEPIGVLEKFCEKDS